MTFPLGSRPWSSAVHSMETWPTLQPHRDPSGLPFAGWENISWPPMDAEELTFHDVSHPTGV